MPFNLGGPELIFILVIVLIVFGAGRLPEVRRAGVRSDTSHAVNGGVPARTFRDDRFQGA